MGAALAERSAHVGPGARAGHPPSPSALSSRARVLDGALACVARFGVAKTTVEDVAREARLSRATLYRLFPGGRDELIGALLGREVEKFFSELSARMARAATLEDRLVTFLSSAAAQIADHDALRVVLAHEPELLLPHLSFTGFDRVLAVFADFLEPYLSPPLEAEDARRVGEWLVRLLLSFALCPPHEVETASFAGGGHTVGLTRPLRPEEIPADRVRFLVKHFLVPGIELRVGRSRPSASALRVAALDLPIPSEPEGEEPPWHR
jgi:AcrR family transcriptional regulator